MLRAASELRRDGSGAKTREASLSVPAATSTTVGGTKTVTVRATAWWNTPEFELHVSGVATDGRRAVTTSGGTYSLYTFQVPSGTSINDLRIDFDHSPAADIGVDYIEIDGEQYHMWLGTVAKLGNYNEGCANVTYAAVTSLSCAGYFDFSGVVPTGTTTTTAGGGATTTTALATTTTVLATTTTTAGGTTTTTTPGGGSGGGGGAVSVVRVHHSFNGQAVGTTINGEFVLSVSDHLGSASVNREAGGETSVQQYTPFGAVRGAAGELLSDWTFTGQTDDPGTGLVDFNARHYDPQLGRFVMVDTVLDGLNRYTYVRNNPLNATDPTGHCPSQSAEAAEACLAYADFETSGIADGLTSYFLEGVVGPLLDGTLPTYQPDYASVYGWSGTELEAMTWAYNTYFDGVGFEPEMHTSQRYQTFRDEGTLSASLLGSDMYRGLTTAFFFELAAALVGGKGMRNAVFRTTGPLRNGLQRFLSRTGRLCSFSEDTEVLLADGTTKPISEVEVGDWVLAEDPETGERGAREVTDLWVHQDTLIDLEMDGHAVATTEDHPFWNATDSEWQRADALDRGDLLLSADGDLVEVGGLDWLSARTTTAYNLTVDGIHTYYVQVGDDEVLVHNVCVPRPRVKPNKPATPPSWTTNEGYSALTTDANPVAAATRIMDDFYSGGWTGRGAGSEFSQIQKWLSRNFEWS